MKIVDIHDVNDCLEGLVIKKVVFDREIGREFIDFISRFGELEYHPDFARPYFRVDVSDSFILKGIRGKRQATLILSRDNPDKANTHFNKLLKEYQENYKGIAEKEASELSGDL